MIICFCTAKRTLS